MNKTHHCPAILYLNPSFMITNPDLSSSTKIKKNSDGMIPVIVQDDTTDEVLMLAYMNEEAFECTIRTEKMTYFSRSRNTLWVKGETSGHYQYVKSLTIDCDKDTILERLINDDIYILLEEITRWNDKNVFIRSLNNSLGSNSEIILNILIKILV